MRWGRQDTIHSQFGEAIWIFIFFKELAKLYLMGWGNIYKRRMKVFTSTFLIYLDYRPCSRERNRQEDQIMTVYGRKLMSGILNVFLS
ncbi:hypothetical protein L1987_71238 [Smallanthus sonchifolius]|uniref:Uncharacterized protein n=1 Tax=Smallanthus sonchifolius TaxID=185202 RepID=A0ACB9AT85_9ASTR|nr:hypothetical protein L1987_71238 [Smallanthus sonchifolius]